MSLFMLLGSDMWVLINYMSFVQWLSVGGSICGMIYLRVKQPDRHRPIKVRKGHLKNKTKYDGI